MSPPTLDSNSANADEHSSESKIPPSSNIDPLSDEDNSEDEMDDPLPKETVKEEESS